MPTALKQAKVPSTKWEAASGKKTTWEQHCSQTTMTLLGTPENVLDLFCRKTGWIEKIVGTKIQFHALIFVVTSDYNAMTLPLFRKYREKNIGCSYITIFLSLVVGREGFHLSKDKSQMWYEYLCLRARKNVVKKEKHFIYVLMSFFIFLIPLE